MPMCIKINLTNEIMECLDSKDQENANDTIDFFCNGAIIGADQLCEDKKAIELIRKPISQVINREINHKSIRSRLVPLLQFIDKNQERNGELFFEANNLKFKN